MTEVLIFPDDGGTLAVTEDETDVLVIQQPTTEMQVEEGSRGTFALVDSPTPQTDTVVVPSDFVLFSSPQPTVAKDIDTGAETLILASAGGARGPQGPPGENYYAEFSFSTAQTQWIIEHNQDTFGLMIQTFDSNGERVVGDVEYPSKNQITVTWYYPMTGVARVFN